jgi:orotidine-5'-phosphate decarboxylase
MHLSSTEESFPARLAAAASRNNSWLMIGLDPVLERLPDGFSRDPNGALEFNRRIIEATRDLVIGYKPNFAFYEAMGPAGWDVLAKTREAIPPDLIALADAKRGDIGNTSEMYARAIFDRLGFDAVTLSPYTGREGLQPFLNRRGRGAFILCRTSNRDGIQDVKTDLGAPVYEMVARSAAGWGDDVGLVVGATDIDALRRIRAIAPRTPLLIPGVGAQGGALEEAFTAGIDADGGNALISVSRSVLYASSGADFAEVARREVRELLLSMRSFARESGAGN